MAAAKLHHVPRSHLPGVRYQERGYQRHQDPCHRPRSVGCSERLRFRGSCSCWRYAAPVDAAVAPKVAIARGVVAVGDFRG